MSAPAIDLIIRIIKLAKQMRLAQKEYFRMRSGDALQRSKRLENALDEALEQIDDEGREMQRQNQLFPTARQAWQDGA